MEFIRLRFTHHLILKGVKFVLVVLLVGACQQPPHPDQYDWDHYQGDPGSNQYSPLRQINRDNIHGLEVAWVYNTGDVDTLNRSQIQCNPLIIDGILYGTSPKLKLFALHAATGEPIWEFDPFENQYDQYGMGVNRGLAWWTDGEHQRLYYGAGPHVYSIDAKSGRPDPAFGEGGRVSLNVGLGERAEGLFISSNTPGVVYKDLLIIGSRVSEAMGAAPGHVRALNVRTGELVWTFHTIPKPGELGHDTWPEGAWQEIGGANAWSGMSVDHERGIVYVPTGSAAYDFYGGDRHGENLFANTLLALNARTGERIWHYQVVRHDLWDRDLPAPPNLVTLQMGRRQVDAVAQITKSGLVFVFDRQTGEPLFPIEEIEGLPSDLKGEATWPKQPVPQKPTRFARHEFKEEEITQRTPEAHTYVRALWHSFRKGQEFIPPSTEGTILLPGFDGGGEWGGAAVDPDGIMYVNASEMPWIIKMIEYTDEEDGLLASRGKNLYGVHCQICHGQDLAGASVYTVPSLSGLKDRLSAAEIEEVIKGGRGMMPSFSFLNDHAVRAITAFLQGSDERLSAEDPPSRFARDSWKYPYFMSGYVKFRDQDGYPAITPPWGTLNAIDLNRGEIKWKVTFGDYPELGQPDGQPTGSESYGGPVVTAGGVLVIAAARDEKIRAYDKSTGRLLWQHDLPAAGYATPSTYMVDGRQYIVIACGGGKLETKAGHSYVAFALP